MTDAGNGLTYAQAGVDIDAGEALVAAIKPLARAHRAARLDALAGAASARCSTLRPRATPTR